MSEVTKNHDGLEQIYQRVLEVLTEARGRAWQVVNSVMVASYWEVGRIIFEEEHRGFEFFDHTV